MQGKGTYVKLTQDIFIPNTSIMITTHTFMEGIHKRQGDLNVEYTVQYTRKETMIE